MAICLHLFIVNKAGIKDSFWGYSLAVQCLELGTFTARDWGQSLVWELGATNCVGVVLKKKSFCTGTIEKLRSKSTNGYWIKASIKVSNKNIYICK